MTPSVWHTKMRLWTHKRLHSLPLTLSLIYLPHLNSFPLSLAISLPLSIPSLYSHFLPPSLSFFLSTHTRSSHCLQLSLSLHFLLLSLSLSTSSICLSLSLHFLPLAPSLSLHFFPSLSLPLNSVSPLLTLSTPLSQRRIHYLNSVSTPFTSSLSHRSTLSSSLFLSTVEVT